MKIRCSRNERIAMRASEQGFGVVVMLTVIRDVFLTELHARIETGILSPKLTGLTWRLFRGPPAGRYEPMVSAFHGTAILLLLVSTRSKLLASGAGLITQPERGTGVWASSGETPTDLGTAVYPGGGSLLHRRRERFRAAYSGHQNSDLQESPKAAHHRRGSFIRVCYRLNGLSRLAFSSF